ncbi:MAG: octaprenyl diphosphate synthase [Gammaproteobacteria bacterium]|nr:MAG: octaprenyl diphosphate synthase [Gammaproteobacteria bacterium]
MDFSEISELMSDEMSAVDQLIIERLKSDIALVNQLGYYIINSGGKRLRPLLLVLVAKALGYQGKWHVNLAAIIEFIHTATLLHDDVVDESDLRRGNETANALFGNAASVLVGDYLYSRSFQMMVDVENLRIMEVLSATTNTIAEGEVMQLMNCNDPDTSIENYLDVIHHKTATLFEAATRLGAIISDADPKLEQAMADYGLHIGNAFQLVDDALDYSSDAEQLGKNIGDDLAEGKPTLPLILAMQRGTDSQKEMIKKAIEEGGLDQLEEITQAIRETGALEGTMEQAKQEIIKANAALGLLPDTPYKEALQALANISIERTS